MRSKIPTAMVMKWLTPSPYTCRSCIKTFTPQIEPGTLPSPAPERLCASPFLLEVHQAGTGILVKKLNSASDPTAIMRGTLEPNIRTGSRRTPPPTPVIPMRVPTTNPIKTLSTKFHWSYAATLLQARLRLLR